MARSRTLHLASYIGSGAVPDWLPTPGALLDVDFAADRAFFNGQTFSSVAAYLASAGLSFTRGSKKITAKKDGSLVQFDNDVPARTDRGARLEPAATNYVPYSSDMTGAGWGGVSSGTAPTGSASPVNATMISMTHLPDGIGVPVGQGLSPSGIVWDAVRARFLIANDGGTAVNSVYQRQTSIVSVDASFKKINEWPITWPGDATNNQGIQGIGVDTRRDLVFAVVPSHSYIAFFDPFTMAFIRKLDLPAGMQPNGVAYDRLRDCYWVVDNVTLWIHQISLSGQIVRTYKPGLSESSGLDHLSYLPFTDELLFTAGANNVAGKLFTIDCKRLRVKRAMACPEALSIEGACVMGSTVYVVSDAATHGAPAPYNDNLVIQYPITALQNFAYQRLWPDFADFNGLGMKADRLILDKGPGISSSDYRTWAITAADSGATAIKTVSVWMKATNEGERYLVNLRGGSTSVLQEVTDKWQRFSVTASMVAAPNVQISLGAALTSSFADILVAGFQCELGAAPTSLIENTGAAPAARAADQGVVAVLPSPRDLVATLDDGSTQVFAAVTGNFAVPTGLSRPVARLVAMAA